jgi:hypothetical protein
VFLGPLAMALAIAVAATRRHFGNKTGACAIIAARRPGILRSPCGHSCASAFANFGKAGALAWARRACLVLLEGVAKKTRGG